MRNPPTTVAEALRRHWPEYWMEAASLGIFLFILCVATVLLEHPAAPLRMLLASPFQRRVILGAVMGLTLFLLICSPWGQRSGAHMNPALTVSMYALGRIGGFDALFYVVAQFVGAAAGVALASLIIGMPLRHNLVLYAATTPGAAGNQSAFLAELLLSALLLAGLLATSNSRRWFPLTPALAAGLMGVFLVVAGPISGMSTNPARSYASALMAGEWSGIWIYLLAPTAGMLLAALFHRWLNGEAGTYCAKLHHANGYRCIFLCRFGQLLAIPEGIPLK